MASDEQAKRNTQHATHGNTQMTFGQWSKTVAGKIERRARNKARVQLLKRIAKAIAKEAGLLIVMMTVTTLIVSIETGSLEKGLHIALIAGPVKATAAAVYGRLVG